MTLMDLFIKQIEDKEELNDLQKAVIDHVLERVNTATQLEELTNGNKTTNTN